MRRQFCLGFCLAFLFAAVSSQAGETPSPAAAPANMIENGGFEEWAPLDPNTARQEGVRNVNLLPANYAPVGWVPQRERVKGQARTGTIAMDEKVRHSGARSVRIENRDMTDITYVLYTTERFARGKTDDPRNIRPNRRYVVRWWVKGDDVRLDGTGPILMMYVLSEKDGKSYRTNASEPGDTLLKGTFDWQRREFIFITDECARWAAFTFQLRWTIGTVWYDDVELLDTGPVVPVKTF